MDLSKQIAAAESNCASILAEHDALVDPTAEALQSYRDRYSAAQAEYMRLLNARGNQ